MIVVAFAFFPHLLKGKNRLRINGVGVSDVIHFDPSKIVHHQLDDLVSLGKLIMCLACRSAAAAQNVQRSLEIIGLLKIISIFCYLMFCSRRNIQC